NTAIMQSYLNRTITRLPTIELVYDGKTFIGHQGTVKDASIIAQSGLTSAYACSVWLPLSANVNKDAVVTINGKSFAVGAVSETATYLRLDLKTISIK
ncbi:MAG: hypothetical protein WC426_14275, partial [Sulfuriferula sp.]